MDIVSELIVNAVEKVRNAVVKIDKYSKENGRERFSGSGSGFVFSSDGLIFTNAHVVSDSDRLKITLLDGSELSGDVTGIDADTDVAIIKVYGSGYTPAKLGSSGTLKIGQLIIAIGNPFGYQHSVSFGVLSGVGRTMRSPDGHLIDNILQSEVALNPGNSGGPMIDTNGEVIGINSAIAQNAQGLSFSIGIDSVKEIAKYLIQDGKVTKAYLGIILHEIEINPRIRNFYRLNSRKGILIAGLEKLSPAANALLREGDIIVEFDGSVIGSSIDLTNQLIGGKLIHHPTKIKILRQTKMIELDILPGERPAA